MSKQKITISHQNTCNGMFYFITQTTPDGQEALIGGTECEAHAYEIIASFAKSAAAAVECEK